MRINRFIALAAIAVLVVAAMGFVSTRSFAQTATPPTTEQSGTSETVKGPDTDNVDEQSGQQVEDGQPDGQAASDIAETDAGPDQQSPSYNSSLTVDPAATDGMNETDEAAALSGQAKITIEQAKSAALAANPGAGVVKAELDNENGALVYSVELNTGANVKVDAGSGAILHTDTGADNQD
jgi:uncharacterized membrane protein YkoI